MISFSGSQSPTNAQIRGLLNDVHSKKIDMRHILNSESMKFFETIQKSIIGDLQAAGTNRNLNVVDRIRNKHFKKIVLEQVDSTSINVVPVGLIALSILMDNKIPDFNIRNFRSHCQKGIQDMRREKFLNSPDTFLTRFDSLPSSSLPSTSLSSTSLPSTSLSSSSLPSIQIPSSTIEGPSAPPSPIVPNSDELKQILEFMLGIENIDARHQFVDSVISMMSQEDFENLISELMEFSESEDKTELLNYLLSPINAPESEIVSGDLPPPPSSSSIHEPSSSTGSTSSESPSGPIVGPSAPPSDHIELDSKTIEILASNFISLAEIDDRAIDYFVEDLFEKYSLKDIAKVVKTLLNSAEFENNKYVFDETTKLFIFMQVYPYMMGPENNDLSTHEKFEEELSRLKGFNNWIFSLDKASALKVRNEIIDRLIEGQSFIEAVDSFEMGVKMEQLDDSKPGPSAPIQNSAEMNASINALMNGFVVLKPEDEVESKESPENE